MNSTLNLIPKGGAADRINAKMVQLEGPKAELERQLADAEGPPPLHPKMTPFYLEKVQPSTQHRRTTVKQHG
jgi:site-specific DNA recombinase